eukprot:comp19287_c0_seq1/m.22118 comp19287_c0_seq1/g.22118  ORF comp19287_c0_seq1/g.22118 comp19287_c0_seq1/m.22118 type:complete len:321 (-) comp19287_c0_seq1:297-1259(-)
MLIIVRWTRQPIMSLARAWQGLKAVVSSEGHMHIRSLHASRVLGTALAQQVKEAQWTPTSKRPGVLAVKKGNMTMWDSNGHQTNVTVLQVLDNQVVQVKTADKEGVTALQIGARDLEKFHTERPAGIPSYHWVRKPQQGHFKAAGVPLKRKLADFKVTEDALLPIGTEITCAHFLPGQYVDVQGVTKGKGFQGVIKRWGFKQQPKTHGNTKTTRAPGGMGGCQDPGRVFPGKRMSGHMGNQNATVLSLKVMKIEPRFNLIYVAGSIPGRVDRYVRVKDAQRMQFVVPPPFPTYIPGRDPPLEPELSEGATPVMKKRGAKI